MWRPEAGRPGRPGPARAAGDDGLLEEALLNFLRLLVALPALMGRLLGWLVARAIGRWGLLRGLVAAAALLAAPALGGAYAAGRAEQVHRGLAYVVAGAGAIVCAGLLWGLWDGLRGRPLAGGGARHSRDPHAGVRRPRVRAPARRQRRALERARAERGTWAPGLDERGRPVVVGLEPALSHHALVLGGTGSGKSTLLRGLVAAWLRDPARGAVVAIDCKGDPETFAAPLASLALAARRPYLHWHARGPVAIDPFRDGTRGERVGRIVDAYPWSEEHYRAAAAGYLHALLEAADAAGEGVDLARLERWLRRPEALVAELGEHQAAPGVVEGWVGEGREGARLRAGLAARLASWARSDGADRARAGGLRLSELLRQRALVALSVPASTDEAATARWAQLLVRALLQAAASGRTTAPCLLLVDEAQFAGGPALRAVLQQGRSLGLWAALSFQEAETAYEAVGPAWSNPLTVVCGRQGDGASAERAAGLFGTGRVAVSQYQVAVRGTLLPREGYTGMGSEQWEDVYLAHPQALRELAPGRFFWTTRARGGGRTGTLLLQAVPDVSPSLGEIPPDALTGACYPEWTTGGEQARAPEEPDKGAAWDVKEPEDLPRGRW